MWQSLYLWLWQHNGRKILMFIKSDHAIAVRELYYIFHASTTSTKYVLVDKCQNFYYDMFDFLLKSCMQNNALLSLSHTIFLHTNFPFHTRKSKLVVGPLSPNPPLSEFSYICALAHTNYNLILTFTISNTFI